MSAPQNDFQDDGIVPTQNDYESRTGQKDHIPVQKDEAGVEDPIDPNVADSDQQLGMGTYRTLDSSAQFANTNHQRAMTLMPSTRVTSLMIAPAVLPSHIASLVMMRAFLDQKMAPAVLLADLTRYYSW